MSKAARRATCRAMVEEMKRCREEMVRMVQDIKEKQERAQVLSEEMSKLPKNINRNIYTHRILDIISSIAKQNKEIDKNRPFRFKRNSRVGRGMDIKIKKFNRVK